MCNGPSHQLLCHVDNLESSNTRVLWCRVALTEPIYDTWATVQPDGHVHYSAYYHFRSLCQVTDDSADNIECPLSFGSWVHSTNHMAITTSDRADVESNRANPDFKFISALSHTRERTCDCSPSEKFNEITYTTSNGFWCMGIKGEMSRTVCVSHWHNILTDPLCFAVKPLGMRNRLGTLGRLPGGVSLKFHLLRRIQRDRSLKDHQCANTISIDE